MSGLDRTAEKSHRWYGKRERNKTGFAASANFLLPDLFDAVLNRRMGRAKNMYKEF